MNWISVIWSASAGACLVMALMHVHVWLRDRRSWANLSFAVMVMCVIGFSVFEVVAMRTRSVEVYTRILGWTPYMYALGVAGSLGFIHFYFGTGRRSLLTLALVLRGAVVVATPFVGLNVHIISIQNLDTVAFLGEAVSIPGEWESSRWVLLAQAATLAQLVYMLDATLRLARSPARDARRRAIWVGGSLVLFFLISVVYSGAVASGALRLPFILSLPFLATLLAMSYQLSGEMLRALNLVRALRERELELELAADSANLGVWIHDPATQEMRGSERWREIFGFGSAERVGLPQFAERLHGDDREAGLRALSDASARDGGYEAEYRIVLPDGRLRWIASRGRWEFGADGKPSLLRGVSLDITAREQAALELQQRQEEVARLSRVATLGEISGSLAHELGQPLGAILANAGAAELLLRSATPDLTKLRAIVQDIRHDDQRASEILRGIRAFLQRSPPEMTALQVGDVVRDVVTLVSADAAARKVVIRVEIPDDLPQVSGARVQLQQVLLNLVVNGFEAMATCAHDRRHLVMRARLAEDGRVEVSVADTGVGIAPEERDRLFEAFRTTKRDGLGLGLPICRSIIEAHRGSISVGNNPDGGATARFTLPVASGFEVSAAPQPA